MESITVAGAALSRWRACSMSARPASDIANSGIPVKVGMVPTAHKTVTMFMTYIHTEDDPVRQAAELANRRKTITEAQRGEEATA